MLYLLLSFMISILTWLFYKRNFDIFTDRGSLRKLISSMNLTIVMIILVVSQVAYACVVFYMFVSYFHFVIGFEQAAFAGTIIALLYSTSFRIFKSYGPYIIFSFEKARMAKRVRNSILVALWLVGVSVVGGAVFNALFGIEMVVSIFASGFATTVIAFLAT